MLSAGALIWISCRPLIRLVFCTTCGFIITRMDIFSAVAAQGAAQVTLNIALPCLMFSKIVPAFTSDNINALGPLVLVAILYEAMGITLAWIIGQFFWVPHRFRYGLLVAGGWGNVGDIPTSVVMSVTGAAPFNGVQDQNLSVAYISAFMLVFMMTMFPLGGHRLISMDYVGPDIEPEEVREKMRLKRKALLQSFLRLRFRRHIKLSVENDPELQSTCEKRVTNKEGDFCMVQKHVSFASVEDSETAVPTERVSSLGCSRTQTEIDIHSRVHSSEQMEATTMTTAIDGDPKFEQVISRMDAYPPGMSPPQSSLPNQLASTSSGPSSRKSLAPTNSIKSFLRSLLSPPSVAIVVSFIIALVPDLKALFIVVPGTYMPPAPDGEPPLAFILDATTFVGAASVPLGLMCLGSALARLTLPKKGEWRSLPFGAIGWLAAAKLLIMPVLGVLLCGGLTQAGIIDREDKVLRFVCIFFSVLPTATTQVFLTQVYSGTGSAEHLSTFLIPQYILMFFSMTGLTAYSIQLLF